MKKLIIALYLAVFTISLHGQENNSSINKGTQWHITAGLALLNKLELTCKEDNNSSKWVNSRAKLFFEAGFFKNTNRFKWGLNFMTFRSEFEGKPFNRRLEIPATFIGQPSTYIDFNIKQRFSYRSFQLGFDIGLLRKEFEQGEFNLTGTVYLGYKSKMILNNYYLEPLQYDTMNYVLSKNVIIDQENEIPLPNFGIKFSFHHFFNEFLGIYTSLNSYFDVLNHYPAKTQHDEKIRLFKAYESYGNSYFGFRTKTQIGVFINVGLVFKFN
jgi:hypothetical protein